MALAKRKITRSSVAQALMHELNAELGIEVKLGSDPFFKITRVPTGSLVMDRITGGGFALGRHVELYGDEHVGKSYVMQKTIALSQRRGKVCALIDPEHSFDPEWFEYMGGYPDQLLLHQPENAEDAIAVMMMLANLNKSYQEHGVDPIEIIGIDSVTSLVPLEETSKDPREEPRIAGQARMMSRALRRITTVNKKTLFIWTNQLRTNVGIRFGNPNTTTGGKALRYYATTRISMHRGTQIQEEQMKASAGKLQKKKVKVGAWVQCRVEKDKSTTPYREGAFVFDNRLKRIDEGYEIIQLGLEDGLVEFTGKMLTYTDLDDHTYRMYEKKFAEEIRENEILREELLSVIRDNTIQMAMLGGE